VVGAAQTDPSPSISDLVTMGKSLNFLVLNLFIIFNIREALFDYSDLIGILILTKLGRTVTLISHMGN
jgi:hypothetical protein